MDELKVFENVELGKVRVKEVNGEPWFVAKDVTDVLGYSNSRSAVSNHVFEEDKGVEKIDTLGGTQSLTVINESGVYSLIFNSRLEKAKLFKHWVTSEVLPEIRQTGGYHLPQTYAEALRALADKSEENEKLQIENKEMKPKAEFFDAVADSKDAIEIAHVAKMLNYPGIGRNKLFEILRQKNILDKNNIPYQKYVDKGYFRVIEQKYTVPDGEVRINIKSLVYQKGIDKIRKILKEM